MPTISEQVRALTYDPGARFLAQMVEALQAKVDACCGSEAAAKPGDKKVPGVAALVQPSVPSATDSK